MRQRGLGVRTGCCNKQASGNSHGPANAAAEDEANFADAVYEEDGPPPLVQQDQQKDKNPNKPRRHPRNPAKEEMDAFNIAHANYRSWCLICARVALKEGPRYRQTSYDISKVTLATIAKGDLAM